MTNTQPLLLDTLQIGFAYSLTPDGAPGSYNHALAQSIKNDIDAGNPSACVGMQWEIYDALEQIYGNDDSSLPTGLIPLSLVATPPPFEPNHIKEPHHLISFISESDDAAVSILRNQIGQILDKMGYSHLAALGAPNVAILKEMLVAFLNSLLHNPFFFRDFAGNVKLESLVREAKTREWREERVMPNPADYPNGLHRLQTQRVNRLIIEGIIPKTILERGGYLSTRGVLDQIIPEIGRSGRSISTVKVYGHPAHRPRCRRQFLEYVWNQGWPLSPDQVTFGDMDEFWDPETAQEWCRSPEAWDAYEKDPGRLK